MKTNELGKTGIKVSEVCLGTMTYGEQNTEAEGHEQLDYAFAQGVNFIDTAELYPIPPKAETQGRTEEIIGTWMKARANRDKVILATKVIGRSNMNWFREDGSKGELSRKQIFEAIDKSLKRLQTDYIDLYQLHWPDRPIVWGSNPTVFVPQSGEEIPMSETFAALEELVTAGKIRHIGLSNESPWGTMSALDVAKGKDHIRVRSIQNAYSLVNRTFETGLAEIAIREHVGLLAYSPLAQGFLSGKYLNGALPAGSRKALFQRQQRYETPGAEKAITAYVAFAKEHGLDPSQMALKFAATRPFMTATIIGATTMAQLKNDMAGFNLSWTDELEQGVNTIHLLNCNPCP